MFSSNQRPPEASIKRYSDNDPIVSTNLLSQVKRAFVEVIATSQNGGVGGWGDFGEVQLMKSEKSGNLLMKKVPTHDYSRKRAVYTPCLRRTSECE